jgi:hypothetical protein
MSGYCAQLDSPWVRKQRAHYEKLDVETIIDQAIGKLVREGELDDPMNFDIRTVCEADSPDSKVGN